MYVLRTYIKAHLVKVKAMAEQADKYFRDLNRLTRLGVDVAKKLEEGGKPIISDYNLFLIALDTYRNSKGLYLRKSEPERGDYIRLRKMLLDARILDKDRNYPNIYRISAIFDRDADEICCLTDPYCYISHLSAMQRYGFTNRSPAQLIISIATRKLARDLWANRVEEDFRNVKTDPEKLLYPTIVRHPSIVRGRKIHTVGTSRLGASIEVRGTFARVSEIGRTFFDMVHRPELCGGMKHVIDIWKTNAEDHVEKIISAFENEESKIAHVRAGYIIDEILKVKDERIEAWQRFAQRGSSRLLDPSKPYGPPWSEKWMLSLNV